MRVLVVNAGYSPAMASHPRVASSVEATTTARCAPSSSSTPSPWSLLRRRRRRQRDGPRDAVNTEGAAVTARVHVTRSRRPGVVMGVVESRSQRRKPRRAAVAPRAVSPDEPEPEPEPEPGGDSGGGSPPLDDSTTYLIVACAGELHLSIFFFG